MSISFTAFNDHFEIWTIGLIMKSDAELLTESLAAKEALIFNLTLISFLLLSTKYLMLA